MQKFYYCDKCGGIDLCSSVSDKTCWCCGNTNYIEIPESYGILHWGGDDWDNRDIIDEEVIKKSPNLDPYLFEHRNEIIKEKNDTLNAATARGKEILAEQSRVAHCPTCGSTNLKKISTTAKATNTIMFGLLGTKRNKTFHCNSCDYEW